MIQTVTVPALRAFEVDVVAVQRLSPSYQRITLGGESLTEFRDYRPRGPRDLRIKLVIPTADGELPDLPDLSHGWYQRWRSKLGGRAALRTYTVRRARLDGASPEIDVDFVLHGDGPASTWAVTARVGDRITVVGPTARGEGYGGIEWQPPTPQEHSPVRVLLVGDETALPAISSVLEDLPRGYHGDAVVQVPSPGDFLDVRTAADVELHWVARDAWSGVGSPLPQAVRSVLEKRQDAVTGPDFYAWLAGEAGTVRTLRRYLVHDVGVERRLVSFMGYWRRGRSEGR